MQDTEKKKKEKQEKENIALISDEYVNPDSGLLSRGPPSPLLSHPTQETRDRAALKLSGPRSSLPG